MPTSPLAELICKLDVPDPCVGSLTHHLSQLESVSRRFRENPQHKDLVTFGPYVGRSLLEGCLTAILLRFDPFRSRALDRFAKHPKYDANEVFKHRVQWSGDIYPSDSPPSDTWDPEQKPQGVSRALFSAHVIDTAWVPAAEALLDYNTQSECGLELGFFQSETPLNALKRYQGEIRQLYSYLSKGVHGEFFLSSLAPLDEATCLERLTMVVEYVAQLGLASRFASGCPQGMAPRRAVALYKKIWDELDE